MSAPTGTTGAARFRFAEVLVLVFALVFAFAGLRTVYVNDNGFSRLATVYALVHQGTWFLDAPGGVTENPFAPLTVDKVKVGDHFLSSKPPFMPLCMAGVYWVISSVSGLSFEHQPDWKLLVRMLTVIFGILPYAAGLVFFALTLRDYIASPRVRLALLVALAFGTEYAAFAPQLINHVPGTSFCLGATYFGLGLATGKHAPVPWRFVSFGALGGLAHTFELPLTVFVAVLGLALLWRFPRETMLWGGLGMLPPVLGQAAVLYSNTGLPFPVQLRKELYLFENSPWRAPVGIDGLNEPKALYAFHLLIGRHGVFSLFPILLFGLAAWCTAAYRALPLRGAILASGFCVAVLFAYYIKGTDNYGGAAYGFRWGIGAMPMLLLMAAPLLDTLRNRFAWGVVFAALMVSAYSWWECYRNPWSTDAEWTVRYLFGPTF